jgi:neurofibromin 1
MFHIVSMLAATGPTLIRTSVHGLTVNVIQTACTTMPLPEGSLKKMQFLLTDISDSKHRLLFGLTKPHANAFTITQETMTDTAEPMPLASLEAVVHTLLEALTFGAPSMGKLTINHQQVFFCIHINHHSYAVLSIDVANMWRARWMSLVTSSAFQFNPAIQPRAFVVLGCLAQEEVDDDLLYQILVALRGALAIFNESDSNLITSIMMCLKNIVESLPADSRYLQQLFWLAMALVQINHPATFATAVDLLQAALRALDANGFFNDEPVVDVLMAAREPLVGVARLLDEASGVNFETHFSFAVAGILMKGMKHSNPKNTVFQGLTTFLDIECKHTMEQNIVESKTLGYLAGLLPIAAKNLALKELLRLAGINDVEIENSEIGTTYFRIFDKLDIPNNTTALLLVSLLVTMLNSADNETERLFLYGILAEAAVAIPEVFALM